MDVVKDAVQKGRDLNIYNNEGLTLVMVAMKARQFAVTEYLVEQKVDLDMQTDSKDIAPSLNARDFLKSTSMEDEVKNIFLGILDQEKFESEKLENFVYSAIGLKMWIFKMAYE